MMDLKNRIAIVTGAAHGIGREIALSLARAGADIVVTDISEKVFEVGKQIESLNSKTLVLKCDVSQFEQAENAKKQITDEFENIDILVNNAGVYPQKSFLEMTEDDWNQVMHVNLDGVFHCTKVVLPKMVERKYGKIINISSIAGAIVGFSNLVHYSASKAAVVGFTKSLALEVAQYGINVNAIAPGPVDVGEDMKIDAEVFTQLAKIIPIGRVGRPIDIANLVVFLASNESNFITGQCIVSDGGYTLP
jgi:3-oxoacyl-[acyl-carrier protein] reductase